MKHIATLFLVVLSLAGCAALRPAQPTPAPRSGGSEKADGNAGYDARLTGYDYPYEVSIYKAHVQQQDLEMAFMDVHPDEPNGRTVLLLHGKNFSGAYWGSTMYELLAQGYRVIAPDQIGFGKSSKPAHFQYSFHALATLTRGLLQARGITEVSVVGHSMGGMLATRFALMFPETTERLVLVNPIGLEDWKRRVPYLTISEWYARELAKTPEAVRSYMTKSYFDDVWKPAYEPLVDIQVGWIKGSDYQRIAWNSALAYDMIFTQPVLYEFHGVTSPTLLIIGQRDRTALGKNLVTPEVAATLGDYPALGRAAASAIPNAQLVELDGIGHIPQYEAFDEYIDALLGFLAETPE